MNKIFLMGRLTKEVELRYSNNDSSLAIARYTLAVDRPKKKDQEKAEVDFINCVAFGKAGEFASKYFGKGLRVLVCGRLQIDKSEKDGKTSYYTNIIVESQEFADGKKETTPTTNPEEGFEPMTEEQNTDDETLPFV